MSFLTRVKNLFTTRAVYSGNTTLKNPAYWWVRLFGGDVSGVTVNRQTITGLSAVWACVKILSETIASVPFEVYQETGGQIRKAREHYLYDLINNSPSNLYTSYILRETVMSHLCLDGNGYIRKHYNGAGRITELEILKPELVEPYMVQNELWYRYRPINQPHQDFAPEEVIHIPALSFDGLKGKNPIQVQRENFGLSLASQKYGTKFFENGAHVSGAVKVPAKLTKDQTQRLTNQINTKYGGVDNVGRTLVLESGMEYQSIGIKPADALFIETRKFQLEEIARIYRVPLNMLGAQEKATFNNGERNNINFVVYTLRPWVKRWEQEFNRKLFTDAERRAGYYVRFNLDGLMRGDSAARAQFYRELYNIRALNPNEIRALENLNPYDGGDQYGQPLASNTKENVSNEN